MASSSTNAWRSPSASLLFLLIFMLFAARPAKAQVSIWNALSYFHLADGSFVSVNIYYTNSSSFCNVSSLCAIEPSAFGASLLGQTQQYNDVFFPCIDISGSLTFTVDCIPNDIEAGDQLVVNVVDGSLTPNSPNVPVAYSISGFGTYGYPSDPQINLPIVQGYEGGIVITEIPCPPGGGGGIYSVCPTGAALVITTGNLPNATSGKAYSTTFTGSGGSGVGYSWSIASGSLPSGFTLSSSGVLSTTGAPVAAPQSYAFTVRLSDSAGHVATKALTLTVNPNPSLSPQIYFDGHDIIGIPQTVVAGQRIDLTTVLPQGATLRLMANISGM